MFLLLSIFKYAGYAIGIRTKLNPQSRIHRNWSSVVLGLVLAGSGEKKSRRLNPFHAGSLFTFGAARAAGPDKVMAATAIPLVAIKFLLFILYESLVANISEAGRPAL